MVLCHPRIEDLFFSLGTPPTTSPDFLEDALHLLNNRLGRITALIALGGAALYSQGTQTANITDPGAPKNAVVNLFTVEYRFPAATVRMDTGYCEGRDCISLRAQRMAP